MHKRAFYGIGALAVAAGLLLAGQQLRKQQDAEALATRALRLLHASAQDAPELAHLQAAKARLILDDALALFETKRLHGLRHLASALAYLQKDDLERTTARLKEAENRIGTTADTLFIHAELARRARHFASAVRALDEALTMTPGHTRATLLRSDLHMLSGQPAQALETASSLTSTQGDSASVQNRRGIALEALDRRDEATQAFENAITLAPRLYSARLNLARRLRADGRSEAALLAFIEAQRRAPANAAPYVGMGLCRLTLGDLHGATADLEKALSIEPGNPEAHIGMGDLAAARRDAAQAFRHYRIALRHRPDNAVALLKQGNALMLLGRHDDAADFYRKAIAAAPKLSAAHNGLGAALLATQDRQGAALALAKAADLNQSDPNPMLNLARLHRQAGDLDQAQLAMAEAQRRSPAAFAD